MYKLKFDNNSVAIVRQRHYAGDGDVQYVTNIYQ